MTQAGYSGPRYIFNGANYRGDALPINQYFSIMEAKLMISICLLWLSFAIVASGPLGRKKVLILGAGAAGITAAKTLYDRGVTDFLVLEGQDYIGGRIKQASLAGVKMELGANWIQYADEEDNPLIPLKNKHNLTGQNSNFSNLSFR